MRRPTFAPTCENLRQRGAQIAMTINPNIFSYFAAMAAESDVGKQARRAALSLNLLSLGHNLVLLWKIHTRFGKFHSLHVR